jgi:hypothetical protein
MFEDTLSSSSDAIATPIVLTYNSTHRLALDEYGIFFVFPILIPSFKLLFVYLISENVY